MGIEFHLEKGKDRKIGEHKEPDIVKEEKKRKKRELKEQKKLEKQKKKEEKKAAKREGNSELRERKGEKKKVEKNEKDSKPAELESKEKVNVHSWKSFFPFTKEAKALRKKKSKLKKPRRKFSFLRYMKRAGYEFADEKTVKRGLFRASVALALILSFFIILSATQADKGVKSLLIFMLGYWTFFYLFILIVLTFGFALFLDIKAYKRTKEVEAVLPDFLQLASANVSAGMPLDRALWFAVRPQFGILAKEIEEVAKATYAGKELHESLREFSERFDSKVLKRSVSLILEGMSAGGEMAELLTKISMNIEETNILKKEMSANVTTYVIFIGFATVLGAPFLFGLATQLLAVIKSIAGSLGTTATSSSSMSFNITSNAVKMSDFKMYCSMMLIVGSFFSAAIISVIRKGNIKEGAVLIPVFMILTVLLYYVANLALGALMGAFI